MYQAILLAAGNSSRSGLAYNKVLHNINGKPIIYLSALNFLNDDRCNKVFLVCKENEIELFKNVFKFEEKVCLVIGGQTRQESVNNALKEVNSKVVVIHDGARPNYSKDMLNEIISKLNTYNAVIPAIKETDTIKIVKDNIVINTLNREYVYKVQTPQGFNTELIKNVHALAIKNTYTDDSSMVEELSDEKVYVINGEVSNIKYTLKEDF